MSKNAISHCSTAFFCAALVLLGAGAHADAPDNIILLIGDGYGFNHALSANYYLEGEAGAQQFQQQFHLLALRTDSADGHGYDPNSAWTDPAYVKQGATDSAAAGTAMAAGVKTNNGVIGVDINGAPVESVVERAESVGKATGLVTSVQLSHATPAAFAAHSKNRNLYEQIANQMIRESAIDVLMGAGHPFYDSAGQETSEPNYQYVGGEETWQGLEAGRIGGDADGDWAPDPWTLIQTRSEFQQLAYSVGPKRVLGVPQVRKTLQQMRAGVDDDTKDDAPYEAPRMESIPTLAEMTAGALNMLAFDADGFFLMVEGGAIDWASHANEGGRMIEETADFYETVDVVIKWVENHSSWDDTLVIVTSDHECGYLTGEGAIVPENRGEGRMPKLSWRSTNHTNALVPFHVKGAGSEQFMNVADAMDPMRGRYLDNTDVAKTISQLLREQPASP